MLHSSNLPMHGKEEHATVVRDNGYLQPAVVLMPSARLSPAGACIAHCAIEYTNWSHINVNAESREAVVTRRQDQWVERRQHELSRKLQGHVHTFQRPDAHKTTCATRNPSFTFTDSPHKRVTHPTPPHPTPTPFTLWPRRCCMCHALQVTSLEHKPHPPHSVFQDNAIPQPANGRRT